MLPVELAEVYHLGPIVPGSTGPGYRRSTPDGPGIETVSGERGLLVRHGLLLLLAAIWYRNFGSKLGSPPTPYFQTPPPGLGFRVEHSVRA
eukprot:355744-Hanusia_phi.AAC.1